ncbi:Uncharacterised protein (plasmid) [Legionella adelaidensis]|uniref:Uncharacterized protein n=1 Tax=Legionella adelaidensis TaxID=45056 RepID=A0A0W0R2L3_9GAMM|nr:hypothetical protein [Legionella adelaidensis]KTC65345.1 hypothetical protein Lade_0003 [Legionella adelaidensis]VEH84833.1 Uncharacterised protein [Legionella adelaidensis]
MRGLPLRQRVGISFGILWLLVSILVSLFFANVESVMTGVIIFLILGVFPVIIISCLWWISEGVNWTKNKLIITLSVIITVTLIVFCYAYMSTDSSKALLNSRWGMSEQEVKNANGEGNSQWGKGLIPMDMDGDRGVIQPAPSSTHNAEKVVVVSQNSLFLPEYSKSFIVGYYFLDNSLYGYDLSYSTDSKEEINAILEKLRDKYGKGMVLKKAPEDENEIVAIGWVQKKEHIFFSVRSRVDDGILKYFVNIEITYLPIYNKIYNL